MSETNQIKIPIGDQTITVSVQRPDQREALEKVGKAMNDRLKAYAQGKTTSDANRMLAMLAFDSMVAKYLGEEKSKERLNVLSQRLRNLHHLVDSALSR